MTYSSTPKMQDFHINGVKHITPEDAFAALSGDDVLFVDVREASEYKLERIDAEHVMLLPMSVIVDQTDKLPDNKTLIIVCRAGMRSTKVANLLKYQGFDDVYNLDGGIMMWKLFGLPFVNNAPSSCGCNCGCS